MNKNMKPLSELQQEFAAQHHHLVTRFLRKKGLSDEYYDVVIFRYLRAAQQYCEDQALRRFRFATIANNAMDWALKDYWRKQGQEEIKAVSLDYLIADDMTLYDVIPSQDKDVCDLVCDRITRRQIIAEKCGKVRALQIAPGTFPRKSKLARLRPAERYTVAA